eukprot:TRINITY_DN4371_c0_g1_i2.p1 TRINITY_DN4371_c0_g1~~TRINITY_DN4371_c0_g1_i2.p1  ORF type:complete len:321 (+),score=76.47 TRINITY_DN4371_c0_g1_i2:3-965(+)
MFLTPKARVYLPHHPMFLTPAVLLLLIALAQANTKCANTDPAGSLYDVAVNKNLKFIFFGGKGGVGKTTTSSSFATKLAFERHRQGLGGVLLISTDPAHSLGDAFRMSFSGEPTPIEGVPGLDVMEIDPTVVLNSEIDTWKKMVKDSGMKEIAEEVQKLQQWLVSIPGIDEATALSSVIGHIESGKYSAIVFDTAPTGHTIKLLHLPEVLQAGLSQLQSWQAKLWGYYKAFTGFLSLANNGKEKKVDPAETFRKNMEAKLTNYKAGIEKVGKMLKDNVKTTFVTVCIAEYLSVSETQRLLQELKSQSIHTSHIVVNQVGV